MNRQTTTLLLTATLSFHAFAESAASAQEPDDPGLVLAQVFLEEGIEKSVLLDEEREVLVMDSSAPALTLEAPFVLDVQRGNWGGSITFARFTVGVSSVAVEELSYSSGRRSSRGNARRTTLEPEEAAHLVHLVRALFRTKVFTRPRPNAPLGGSSSWSSRDFYAMARLQRQGSPMIEREYCGFVNSRSSLHYAGIEVVVKAARILLQEADDWTEVPEESRRQTHFTAAFVENGELMLLGGHWWVMELSVEALGLFGNRGALDTLRDLRERHQSSVPRGHNKIRNVLASPDHYLEGPPQKVPDTAPVSSSGR